MCCSVLQCVAVCCSVLQCVAECGSVLQSGQVCIHCLCQDTRLTACGGGNIIMHTAVGPEKNNGNLEKSRANLSDPAKTEKRGEFVRR